MKNYFIRKNNENLGPFSLEELKVQGLKKDDFIWKDGLHDWQPAESLEEFKDIFSTTPPPFNNSTPATSKVVQTEQAYFETESRKSSGFSRRLVLFFLIVIAIGGAAFYNKYQAENKNYNEYNDKEEYSTSSSYEDEEEPEDREKTRPEEFIDADGTYRKNLVGKYVIEGSVSNHAKHTNYKDVMVKVTFYTATKTEIGSENYMVYKYLPYGSTEEFKIKVKAPRATESCGLEVMDATAY
jgi:hypothetical protein